jgi:8-oxo-dGTP pyrophosphatase MutT (NUDIX family)
MALTFADIEAALALGPFEQRSDYDLNRAHWPEPAAEPPRKAAVLCGLVERDVGLSVVLTRRAGHLSDHAGQIGFPGGKIESDDPSARAAALREAEEEIGLSPAQVALLGPLDSYRTGTGFRVYPFVGRITDPEWQAVPDPSEVDEVFETPLDFLMDEINHRRHAYERDGMTRHFWAMPWGDYFIWGATAGMLKNLSDRLRVVGS